LSIGGDTRSGPGAEYVLSLSRAVSRSSIVNNESDWRLRELEASSRWVRLARMAESRLRMWGRGVYWDANAVRQLERYVSGVVDRVPLWRIVDASLIDLLLVGANFRIFVQNRRKRRQRSSFSMRSSSPDQITSLIVVIWEL
jgi:hypothetical protein